LDSLDATAAEALLQLLQQKGFSDDQIAKLRQQIPSLNTDSAASTPVYEQATKKRRSIWENFEAKRISLKNLD